MIFACPCQACRRRRAFCRDGLWIRRTVPGRDQLTARGCQQPNTQRTRCPSSSRRRQNMYTWLIDAGRQRHGRGQRLPRRPPRAFFWRMQSFRALGPYGSVRNSNSLSFRFGLPFWIGNAFFYQGLFGLHSEERKYIWHQRWKKCVQMNCVDAEGKVCDSEMRR